MERRSRWFGAGLVLFATIGAVAGCPGGQTANLSTPDGAFLATQAAIEAGDYTAGWDAMSVGCRRAWISGTDEQKAQFARSGQNYGEFERFLMNQYGVNGETFLATAPKKLHALFLEHNRKKVLSYRISGEPRIEGDTAYLFISVGDDLSGSEWRYVRDVDRWLLDEGLGGISKPD